MYGERAPIYGDDKAGTVRVISAPNGLWQAQRRVTHTEGTKTFDPWENVGMACAKHHACAIVFGPQGPAA